MRVMGGVKQHYAHHRASVELTATIDFSVGNVLDCTDCRRDLLI